MKLQFSGTLQSQEYVLMMKIPDNGFDVQSFLLKLLQMSFLLGQ